VPTPLPSTIRDIAHLEEVLSEPTEGVIETMADLKGDMIILGVGGKMGPTLARMARRADERAGVKRAIYAVSRFGAGDTLRRQLEQHGIQTIPCDLLDPRQLASLPECPNVVSMFGFKFGSTGQEATTWAMNSFLPGVVCQKFAASRIVLFSSGNVYSLSPIAQGGSVEADPLSANGEYAASCIGRERVAEYWSRTHGIPMSILRLNYACELRYGVLVDIAQQVFAEVPIDVTMGCLNAIWQADANAMALCTFRHLTSPPLVLNLAGPETLSVRRVAQQFGAYFSKAVRIEGREGPDAILSNGQRAHRLYGYPRVGPEQMIAWIADWICRGGETLGKPTHFEVRDGKY
jgi:nucleoside-diphosphate-sugar epimerase